MGIRVVEGPEILDEPSLSLIQRCRRNLECTAVQKEQWLVQVASKPYCLEAPEFPRPQLVVLNRLLQLLELSDDFRLRLIDQNAIAIFWAHLLNDRGKIRIVRGNGHVFQVRQLPLALPKTVVALHVL